MASRKHATPDTDAIKDIRLLDVDGKRIRLGSLWEDGPAVLVWLRHYG
jgi:hypothetical protein